jgi:hypothetical protein
MATRNEVSIPISKRVWTKCKVEIRGSGGAGIMFHSMSDTTLEALRTRTPQTVKTDAKPKDIAMGRLYRENGPESQIGLPADNLWACLVNGGRHQKNGRKQISTREDSTLPAWLRIEEEFIYLTNGDGRLITDKDCEVDKRKGNLPKDNTAVCIVRPKLRQWGMRFTLLVDEDEVSIPTVARLLVVAGKYIGLCEHRRKSPFGKFELVSFVAVNPRKLKGDDAKKTPTAESGADSKKKSEPVAN